jgi:hypothetical protein
LGEYHSFTAGLLFAVPVVAGLYRIGSGNGGRRWALAWFCLYASGSLQVASESHPAIGPLFPVLGTTFAALFV